jgi:hypothetical protein
VAVASLAAAAAAAAAAGGGEVYGAVPEEEGKLHGTRAGRAACEAGLSRAKTTRADPRSAGAPGPSAVRGAGPGGPRARGSYGNVSRVVADARAGERGEIAAAPSASAAEPVADSGRSRARKLETSILGDTTNAPRPYGLPLCIDEHTHNSPPFEHYSSWCSIGCESRFYTIQGTGETMTASTCGMAAGSFVLEDTRLIVREGPAGAPCLELKCVGKHALNLHAFIYSNRNSLSCLALLFLPRTER